MSASRRGAVTRRCAVMLGFAAAVVLASACRPGASTPAASGPSGSAPSSGTPKPAHLTYVLTSLVFNITPVLVAQGKGFLAQENLTVDLPVAGQSASACQQVLAKAADIAQCSLNDMIQADEAGGARLVMVMNEAATALQRVPDWL